MADEDLMMTVDAENSGAAASMAAANGRTGNEPTAISGDKIGMVESPRGLYMCYGDIVSFKVDSEDGTVAG